MTTRKGSTYKTYLNDIRNGKQNVNIPYNTWKGWLLQGRITEEELNKLGIKTSVYYLQVSDVLCKYYYTFIKITDQRRRRARNIPQDLREEQQLQVLPAQPQDNVAITAHLDNDSLNASGVNSGCESGDDDRFDGSINDRVNVSSDDSGSNASNSNSEDEIDDSDERLLSEKKRSLAIMSSKRTGTTVLNGLLHPLLNVTKFEVLFMILHLSMRHRMTDIFLNHLFKFVEYIIGVPDCLGMSKHLYHKLFKFGKEPIQHYYCPKCKSYLGQEKNFPDDEVMCDNEECNWSSTTTSLNDGNYFLTLDIKSQLQDVLSKPDITFVSQVREEGVETDMMDGLEYKHNIKAGILSSDPNALTLTLSTDGSPVFKSGNNSLWPVHFLINEISPKDRFHPENLMLAGVWFGKSEPDMHLLLKPIITELKHLQSDGVIWTRPDGTHVESHVYVFACCTDSVARAKVQNHQQFNGVYGCGLCLHPNTAINVLEKVKISNKGKKKRKRTEKEDEDANYVTREKTIYRFLDQEYQYRSNLELRNHMRLADESNYAHIMGSKGSSEFCSLKRFNVVYGFPIDYLHCVLLGTVKRTANLWFDSTSSGQPYYIGLQIHRVDERLSEITLPNGFRPPRPMSDRVHWKGNEWRAFLLYCGLVVLLNILPMPYYNHFKLLVSAIYVMCKDVILRDELIHAQVLLDKFVRDYQQLYGEINMVFNVHSTSHLPRLVARMGPLWAYSAFPFESANGRLVNLAKGTKGVATQICRKYLMTSNATKLLSHGYEVKPDILDFCSTVIGYEYVKNSLKGENDENLLGNEVLVTLNDIQKQAFIDKNILNCDTVFTVRRAVVDKMLYHSRLTTKQKRACDSCVRLTSGEFALIDLIVVLSRQVGNNLADTRFLVTILNVSTEASPLLVPHIKQCNLDSFGDLRLISSTDIAKKCIFFKCNDKNWVAEISNFFECD